MSLAMPKSLRLVVEHLAAVRELDRYLRASGDVCKDIDWYLKNVLRMAIQRCVGKLNSWNCETGDLAIWWWPGQWEVQQDFIVSIFIEIPEPVGAREVDPSVNLSIPSEWTGHDSLVELLGKEVKSVVESSGFGWDIERDPQFPIVKYVEWAGQDGSFDEAGFLNRIAAATEQLVRLEPRITEAIHAVSGKQTRKRAKK